MNKHIANELIEMARHDLEVREQLLNEGTLSSGYNPDMERVHRKNAARLAEIIDAIGYPTVPKVGKAASEAAWLIVQHAISEPELMRRCYALISQHPEGVNPQNLAYLHDRICYFEGRPQRYGTQFDDRGIYPVEDKEEMIHLRKELGLLAHDEELVVECKRTGHHDNLHPDDSEFNAWRKNVGWL